MKEKKYSNFEPSFLQVLQVQDIFGRWEIVAFKAPSNFSETVNAHFKEVSLF